VWIYSNHLTLKYAMDKRMLHTKAFIR